MNLPLVLGIIAIIIVVNLVLYKFVFGKIKKMQAASAKMAEEDLSGKEIKYGEELANFFGQESLGMAQVRGNGILCITQDKIYFRMLMPSRVFRFPTNGIENIETVKSFLGKTKFVPLMKVTFTNEQGESDSAAFLVRNMSAAQEALGAKMEKWTQPQSN